jgi:hypothetical protein
MSDTTYRERLQNLEQHHVWTALGDYTGGPRECKDKTVYSSSRLGAACGCTWAYKLSYEDKLPEETRALGSWRGTLTHRAIAKLHVENAWGAVPEVFAVAEAQSLEELETDDKPWSKRDCGVKDVAEAAAESLTMVQAYAARNNPMAMPEEMRVKAIEAQGFMVVKHPRTKTCYRVSMTLDQIRGYYGDTLNITDIKTAAQEPSQVFLARSKQFTIYGMGLKHGLFLDPHTGEFKCYEQYPANMTYLYLPNLIPYKRASTKQGISYKAGDLRGTHEFPVIRNEEEYEKMSAEICRIIQIIRFKLFVRDDDDIRCKMCRHKAACEAGINAKEADVSLADMSDLY